MKYDAVRGWFQLHNINSDKEFQVMDALKILGAYGTSSTSNMAKSSITTVWSEESAEIAATLKAAGFNFLGAKDVPSSERSAS